ncbi:DNA translocase FtsK [Thiomicrorhabdus sediminis]|uniref:DNA translocase FtsK n=1 Tax=Thiomicrorhabdus sediminis TaxID=2580412 RepID=A0A4P9K519_9GAMM|nr:DNA translocase FtsK [Thiomicrorhabdus sediminis]QCU89861.1 DNA translocase FtsK [Thiomicrorhabdus sediminis]
MSFKPNRSQSNAISAESSQDDSGVSKMKRCAWIIKDGVVLSCIGLAFFLFLVLFSYSNTDPGFDSVGDGYAINNYGGKTGAWLASMLLYVFGVFGFLIPFGILLAGWITLKLRNGNETDYLRFVVSLLGLLLLISSGAGLANLFMQPDALVPLPYSAGGVLGYELSNGLVASIDLLGATLLLLVLFAVSISMLSSCSWLTIIEFTGEQAYRFWKFVEQKFNDVVANRSDSDEEKPRVQINDKFAASGDGVAARNKWLHKALAVKQGLTDKVMAKSRRNVSPADEHMEKTIDSSAFKLEPDSAPKLTEENDTVAPQLANQPMTDEPSSDSSQLADSNEPVSLQSNIAAEDSDIAPAVVALEPQSQPVSQVKVGQKQQASNAVIQQKAELPKLELLDPPPSYDEGFSKEELTQLSGLLEQRLMEFGVAVQVESVQPGPVVTRFEILPAPGVKVSQINNLAKDLARVLSVKSVRVVDVIPGKAVVGIEIPNEQREIVSFREVLSSEEFQQASSPLTVALGKDISGKPVVADIAKMPHLLVAGTTGAGKSVGVNSMILSLLYKSTAEQVRLIMVDPKMLELSVYEDIPHLLTPVVTDMSDAANALRWCVFEMDRRYQLMAKMGVRNIAGFNQKVQAAIDKGQPIIDPLYQQKMSFAGEMGEMPPTLEPLPYIVVVVDEFADMIMVVGKEVEQLIARIAQKARAAGIHLILATQRPSVNVITGLIKANIPTRISFMVNTKIDSRTILDQGGAEQLLGMGDMLFMPPGSGSPKRVHGAFMTDEEVHSVAEFIKQQGQPQYLEAITQANHGNDGGAGGSDDAEQDALYDEAVEFVVQGRRVSISSIQRRFKIGYNRAARIVEAMESAGVVSTAGANGNREVLAPKPQE